MTIIAEINQHYNPKGNIYEKYRPLNHESLGIDVNTEKATIKKIADDRIEILKQDNRNMYLLKFRGKNILKIQETEKTEGRKAPLAIISSGRSTWINKMYAKGRDLLGANQRFDGIDDTTPIKDGSKIPIYFPYRLTAEDADQRGFYIFVQQKEYDTYAADLKNTGITVIGYEVGRPYLPVLGFGASRYAAVNFFSHIGTPKAWLLDDNVLYIQRLHEFSFFEEQMNSIQGCWALGGTGQRKYQTDDDLKKIVKAPVYVPPTNHISPHFLQQAVLWDINQLTGNYGQQKQNSFNFSPYFICSGEDVSISYFLGEDKCKAFPDCLIYKSSPDVHSNNRELQKLKSDVYTVVERVGAIPVNDNSTLKKLLVSGKKYLKGESIEITRMKASEQLLLKYMSNENAAAQNADLTSKLLNIVFTFSGKYDVQLMNP